jgi:hypothetical protein
MKRDDAEFQLNLEVFRTRLPQLLDESKDQYVIIASGEIVQVFETYEAALSFGYRSFPSDGAQYLLQKIAPIPERADIHMACRAA